MNEVVMATVVGTVDAFLDISGTHPQTTRQCHLDAHGDEDLLVAVLDEQIHLMDTTGDVPIDAELEPIEEGVDVRFAMVDAATVPQIGVVPKAVTLHELWLAEGAQRVGVLGDARRVRRGAVIP